MRIGQCASRRGGIMKDKVLTAGQTAGQIMKRERLMVDKELSPAQKKHMDRNNDNKISGADFAMMDNKFDIKSKKAKNQKNYNKANDYNTDKYDQSATQSKFTFTAQEEKDYSDHNISARRTEGSIENQRKLREANNKAAMDKDMGKSTLYNKYCKKGRK